MATTLARLAVVLLADTQGLRRGFAQAKGEIRGFNAGVGGSVSALGSLASAARFTAITAGIAAATLALKRFATVGIQAAANFEQLQIAFEVMTGSAEQAIALVSDLKKLSAETPLELQDVQRAAKTLMAMGEPTEAIIDDLKMLGDVAAGVGQPINELAQVFGQVMQAGRLTGNELRQFNERGIPLLTTLSEQMGVSKRAIREMVEEGQISAQDVARAFEAMTAAGGRFENMMERQTNTLTGQWNKLKENLTFIAADTMAPIAEGMKNILVSFNDVLGSASASSAEFKTANKEAADAAREREETLKREEEMMKKATDEYKKAMDAAKSRSESIAQSLRTPQEVFKDSVAELKELADEGLLSWENYARGINNAADAFQKATKRAHEFKNASQIHVAAAEIGTQQARTAVLDARAAAEKQTRVAEEHKKLTAETNKLIMETNRTLKLTKPVVLTRGEL